MHKPQSMVRDFHREVIGPEHGPTSPAEPKLRHGELRAKLILEEAMETVVGLIGSGQAIELFKEMLAAHKEAHRNEPQEPDLVEAIDGLCDTLVVCYGTAEDIGVDLEPFYDEVMKTNMAKAGGPVRADGKRGKPPGWTPPDLKAILDRLVER